MLTFDSVKLRLDREQSLSYMEFNYMILQAYDFYKLFQTQKCILQIEAQTNGVILSTCRTLRRTIKKIVLWIDLL